MRTFFYPDSARSYTASYASAQLTTKAEIKTSLTNGQKTLNLVVQPLTGGDQVVFSLLLSNGTPAGAVGNYQWPSPVTSPVPLWPEYDYCSPTAMGVVCQEYTVPYTAGYLKITGYDAGHNLLSGEYEITYDGQANPARDPRNPTATIQRRCSVRAKGSFADVTVN